MNFKLFFALIPIFMNQFCSRAALISVTALPTNPPSTGNSLTDLQMIIAAISPIVVKLIC